MSSKRSKKDKSASYAPESMQSALKEIRERGKGIRETCRKYGIPRTTIQDRLSGKSTDTIKNRGPEPILGKLGEKQVVEWLNNIAKCGFPVKKTELLDTVQNFIKDHNKPNPFKNDRPGQTWYLNFLKRNPEISRRSAEGTKKARARVTEESVRMWFRELENFLSETGHSEVLEQPARIFNASDSGFSICPKTTKILGPEGSSSLDQVKAGNDKENLSVLVTVNACGQICPPLVVFPYLRLPKAVADSIPADWTVGRSESGWMKGKIFLEYIANFESWIKNNHIQKPVLLLIDGHKSHMSLMLSSNCEQLGIILYALPPNSRNILHPAVFSIFDPLKVHWREVVGNYLLKSEDYSVIKTNFCQMFKDIIAEPEVEANIINGFRACGLFPYNPDAVDYTKCQNKMKRFKRPQDHCETDITNEDLVSTQKVIQHLRRILVKKNVDVKLILREVTKLKKTEPTESQNLYQAGYENAIHPTVHLSTIIMSEGETSDANLEDNGSE